MHLFSVIIPHYNSVSLLKHLIRSIPATDSVQLIVVDDRSTEDVTEAERLVAARGGLFLYNTAGKKGAGACRNLGLEHADGKWLIFADADDYFLCGAFNTLRQYADLSADIIYFSPASRYLNTDVSAKRHLPYEKAVCRYVKYPSDYNEMLLRYKFMSPWSKMIRRSLVSENHVLFDETAAANDVMFSMKTAYCAKSIYATAEQIYCVTSSQNTLTTQRDEEKYWTRVEVFVNRYHFMMKNLNVKKYRKILPRGLSLLGTAFKQNYRITFIYRIFIYLRKHHVAMFFRFL